MKTQRMAHVFVDEIPVETKQGVLYISMECTTAIHRCACGCGQEVVTPLSPTDWSLTFDGDTVSLDPSVGNWSLPCRSHYFIDRGTITWAGNMADAAIELGRARDRRNKTAYFSNGKAPPAPVVVAAPAMAMASPPVRAADTHTGFWAALKTLWKA